MLNFIYDRSKFLLKRNHNSTMSGFEEHEGVKKSLNMKSLNIPLSIKSDINIEDKPVFVDGRNAKRLSTAP